MSDQILGQPEQGSYNLESDGEKNLFQPGSGKSWNNFFGELKSHGIFSLHNPCFLSPK